MFCVVQFCGLRPLIICKYCGLKPLLGFNLVMISFRPETLFSQSNAKRNTSRFAIVQSILQKQLTLPLDKLPNMGYIKSNKVSCFKENR